MWEQWKMTKAWPDLWTLVLALAKAEHYPQHQDIPHFILPGILAWMAHSTFELRYKLYYRSHSFYDDIKLPTFLYKLKKKQKMLEYTHEYDKNDLTFNMVAQKDWFSSLFVIRHISQCVHMNVHFKNKSRVPLWPCSHDEPNLQDPFCAYTE